MAAIDREQDLELLSLTADIVAAHVANNRVALGDFGTLISSVHGAFQSLGEPEVADEPLVAARPAVSIKASVKPDHLVCLEDGKHVLTLKRHLMTHHGLTPADYRMKWTLPADYPMVASDYTERRRALAKSIGLGRKPGSAAKQVEKVTRLTPRFKKSALTEPAPA